MRKSVKRAAHVFVAAGALGLTGPAVAQTSATSAKAATAHAPAGSAVKIEAGSTNEALTACHGRLEELQVELALLGDPGTFAYSLIAKHTGAAIELRGYVPNNLIKNLALEIAKRHCSLPIVDQLQLHSTLLLRTPGDKVDELQEGATRFLAENLSETASHIEIKANALGQITLHGTCESYEQQVEISKKLRGLHSCCSVDSHLTIKPVIRDGHLVKLVTADGSFTLPQNDAPGMAFSTAEQAMTTKEQSTPPGAQIVRLSPIAQVQPAVPSGVMTSKTETTPPLTNKMSASPVPAFKVDAKSTVAMKSDMTATPPDFKLGDPLPPLPETPAVVVNKQFDGSPVATVPDRSAIGQSALKPVQAPATATVAPSTIALAEISTHSKEADKTGVQTKTTDNTLSPIVPVAAMPAKPATPPNGKQWPAAYDTHAAQVAYVTSGVVTFDEIPALPEPPSVLKQEKTSELRKKVAAACGNKAKDIVVEMKPDGAVLVHVKAEAASGQEELTGKILAIPEMASPNVQLDFMLPK